MLAHETLGHFLGLEKTPSIHVKSSINNGEEDAIRIADDYMSHHYDQPRHIASGEFRATSVSVAPEFLRNYEY